MISCATPAFDRSESGPTKGRRFFGVPGRAALLLSLFVVQLVSAQPAITITAWSIDQPLNSLPGGIAGHAYPLIHFVAAGGTAPYSFSAAGLPSGMTLSSEGGLSGTPRSAGTFRITVTATDSSTPVALAAGQDFTLNISGNATLGVAPQSTLNLALNIPFSLQLKAQGGTQQYTWSNAGGTLPAGLALSNTGLLSGSATVPGAFSFRAQIRDSAGASATLPLSLTVGPTQSRVGALSQIATGGGWTTSVYLINNSASQITLSVNFYKNDGTPLQLPVATTMPSGTGPMGPDLAGLAAQLDPHSTLFIQTTGQSIDELSGWVDVLASAPLSGYGIFDYLSWTGTQSEGTVPLVSSFQGTYESPYDNVNGVGTAVALANLSSTANTSVTARIWNASGAQLLVKTITLPANGHTAFALTDLMPAATTNRGIVQFSSDAGTSICGLGLRVSPAGGITSIPQIAGQ